MNNKPRRTTFRSRLEEMVHTLRQDILSGRRPVGDYLPSECALGEQFALSRKSVRKGLDMLVAEGLIVKVPRVGNRIAAPSSEDQAVSVNLACYPSVEEEADLQTLLGQFHAEHPHIRVNTIHLPYSNFPHSIQQYMEQGFIDVLTINLLNFTELVEHRSLELLEPLMEAPELYPFLAEAFGRREAPLVLPFIFSPVVLCYNKELFQKYKLLEPDSGWTWRDLLDTACRIVQETGICGFFSHIASINRFLVFLLQNGFRFETDEDGTYKLDDPKLWESLDACRELIYGQGIAPAFLSENDSDAERMFAERKAAMIMTTYYSMRHLAKADFEYDIAPLPYLNQAKTLLLVTGLAINSRSRKKEAARALVRFLTSTGAQQHIRRYTTSIPAHKPAAEAKEASASGKPSRYHVYREIVPTYGRYTDVNINMADLDTLRNELKLYWSRLEDKEAVIDRLRSKLGRRSEAREPTPTK